MYITFLNQNSTFPLSGCLLVGTITTAGLVN